jgi:aryl-alcohol dehydrogenase-like predicted oxidoreductase
LIASDLQQIENTFWETRSCRHLHRQTYKQNNWEALTSRLAGLAGEIAIAWTLKHPAITGATVGARNTKQVEELVSAVDVRLSQSEIAELETFNH